MLTHGTSLSLDHQDAIAFSDYDAVPALDSSRRTQAREDGRPAMQWSNGRGQDVKPQSDDGPVSSPIAADLCVIGAGSGGLSVAAAAAALGRRVVLLEQHKMGGDCLNYGCVPSKALIAAAHRAHVMRSSAAFGIAPVEPSVDWGGLRAHVRGVIEAIAPNDSVERFTGLGVRVIRAAGRFADRRTVIAGEHRITARRFIVATGSSPALPPIPGLSETPYFTNETIFENDERIGHLAIIGGGPIGLEMAQAFRRLGAAVTVVEAKTALVNDDPELARVVIAALRREGVSLLEGAAVTRVEGRAGAVRLAITGADGPQTVSATHLLVAVGRTPNIADLNLAAAGIKSTPAGIVVDQGLRTSNARVFAIGDCAGGPKFTHLANHHAGIVIRRALFRLPARVGADMIPWVTFTDPELAHVGLAEEAARKRHGAVNVLRWPFHENDRAQAERATEGHIKVVTTRRGQIVGATIVGAHAGELIHIWSLAVAQKLNIRAMTAFIVPYPTRGEVSQRAAYRNFSAAAASPFVRRAVDWLARLG